MDPATFALIESIGNHAIERRFGKVAGARLNTAVGMTGLQLPGQLERAYDRSLARREDMDLATRMTLGDALELNKRAALNPDLRRGISATVNAAVRNATKNQPTNNRIKSLVSNAVRSATKDHPTTNSIRGLIGAAVRNSMPEPSMGFGHAIAGGFGKALGAAGAEALATLAGKGFSFITSFGDKEKREKLLAQVLREDPILKQADKKTVERSYETMTRFAPILSTDIHAVKSFLRQAIISGSGPDYATIRMLADAERAVNPEYK